MSDEPKWKFSREVNAGQLLTVVAFVAPAFLWWGNFNSEMAGIKHSQAQQAESTRTIREDIREVKQEQKVQGQTIDGIKEKINRARL